MRSLKDAKEKGLVHCLSFFVFLRVLDSFFFFFQNHRVDQSVQLKEKRSRHY